MAQKFSKIGLIARLRSSESSETLATLANFLLNRNLDVFVEQNSASLIDHSGCQIVTREALSQHCDLLIVIGGDGSLLNAAHAVVDANIPLLGINRGRLGFLTDIHPEEIEVKVDEVLNGEYIEESRFLITAQLTDIEGNVVGEDDALNDVVLMPGELPHMIEFAIYINDQFVCTERADGMIIATPTGSTAYALSGGGPILHPHLDALVLVPMFPHTLSHRPIVVSGSDKIKLVITKDNECTPKVSCDGKERMSIPPEGTITIHKKENHLRLIHPKDHNYFTSLRSKLGWGTKPSQ